MVWQSETTQEKLARLRRELAQAQEDLIDAEAALADQMVDIRAFEAEYEARTGYLVTLLAGLEAEVEDYLDRIRQRRNKALFGSEYRPADEQFRRTWQRPSKPAPEPPPPPPGPAAQAQIKKLYRQLARRYHPDLAVDEADRLVRTEKMTAVNDAYAARSLTELVMLAEEMETAAIRPPSARGQTEIDMIKALQDELARCRRRIQEIDLEMRTLHNRPIVELALEAKLARRQGRNLLAEMAADLKRKIARKTAERDMIKAQFDELDRGGEISF